MDYAMDSDTVDRIVAEEMGKTLGVALVIDGPAGSYAKAYGTSNKTTPLALNDHVRIGSCTKLFTATAILIQIDKGTIRLTDTLDQYVTGIPNGDTITVQHLLMHESGVNLPADLFTQVVMVLFGGWWPYTRNTALTSIRKSAPLFPPGEQWRYSNANYILLGLILEKVTGKPVGTVITDDVINPLGLTGTMYPTMSKMPAPFSFGYTTLSVFSRENTDLNPEFYGSSGAMVSTVEDLAKIAAALRDGKLLSPATQALREQTSHTGISHPGVGPTEMSYSLGLMKLGDWFGHNGGVPGFGAVAFYEPASGAIFAGVQNLFEAGQQDIERIFLRVAEALYPGTVT